MVDATFEIRGDALVVTPRVRRLDAAAAPAFVEAVRAQVRGRARVVVSLAHVQAVDASGVGALVSVLKAMPPGGTLRLACAGAPVRALLDAIFLDELLPAFDDVPAALQA